MKPYQLTAKQRAYMPYKRMADVILAVVGLIVLALPFCGIALIQKILAPHEPVFFTQERYGKNGVLFSILKFRSMNRNGGMTKFGRFLRNSSIDELPQLLQVITGKMSLVGPRPLIPQEEDMHGMRLENGIYQLRPGITGWAQINGRDYVKNHAKIAYDRQYLENISMHMDVNILWKTVIAVILRKGVK